MLIVDNLETVDDEYVLTFIREVPNPTKIIVTTRHRIDVAYPFRLVAMPEEQSIQLIRETATLKGVALTADECYLLYQRTGGVPLAIVWSIAQMGFGYSVEAVLSRLGQPSSDIAKFCFDAAMERIKDKSAQRLLFALSLFAAAASREALGEIANLTVLDRDDGLVILEKLSLINKIEGRFSLLPLTKTFVDTLLSQDTERKSSFQRAFIDYFHNFCQKFGGMQWRLYPNLDPELKNIQLSIEWAYWLGMWREVANFIGNLVEFLDRRGLWNEVVEYSEMAVEAGRELNDKRVIMQHTCFGLGWVQALRFAKLQEGIEAVQQSQKMAIELNDQRQYAITLRDEGSILRKLERYAAAEQCLLKSLNIFKEIGDQQWEIRTIGLMGTNERSRGNLNKALEYYTEALKKAEDIGETDQIASNLARISVVLCQQGLFEEARTKTKEALSISEQLNIKASIVSNHHLLARIEYALGEVDEAKKHANIAYDTYMKLGKKDRIHEIEELRGAIQQSPNEPMAYLTKYGFAKIVNI